jgi:hypothetical protein
MQRSTSIGKSYHFRMQVKNLFPHFVLCTCQEYIARSYLIYRLNDDCKEIIRLQ